MKNYKFKLDGLLKLRTFREREKKIELGKIVGEIVQTKELIEKIKSEIEDAYISQEKSTAQSTTGSELQFYSMFIKGKNKHLENERAHLDELNEKYENKLQELMFARGEVKVIENMKEKDFVKAKKKYDKKQQETLEELAQIVREQKRKIL